MAELKLLTSKRASLKTQVTRFKDFVNNVTDDKISELQVRLEAIEKTMDEFNDIQLKLELLKPAELELNTRDEFESILFHEIAKAKSIITEFYSRQTQVTRIEASKMSNGVQMSVGAELELRKFNLPHFSGEYDKWYKFKNTFMSLVDKNPKFDRVQKFYRLLECLKGDAERVLSELQVSDENYEIAWTMLKERFEDKQGIIQKHLKTLVDLDVLKYDSASSIRNFLDNFNSHWRALKSLEEPIETWDNLLILLMSRKLCGQTKKTWEEARVTKFRGQPNINDFKAFLLGRCKSLEACEDKENTERQVRLGKREIKTGAYVATNNYEIKCRFCKGRHHIYFCYKLKELSIERRWQEIRQLKLCSNCLKANHSAKECRSEGCKKCGFRHNTLLHRENTNILLNSGCNSNSDEVNQSTVNENRAESAVRTELAHAASVRTNEINANSLVASNEINCKVAQVLLPTVKVHVLNNEGNYKTVRCILDSGSQMCFMTETLAKMLKLPMTRIDLPIVGISKVSTSVKLMVQTKIKSRYNDYETNESFLILERITSDIPSVTFDKSKLNLPKHLNLADEQFSVADEIDILLNARIFFEALCEDKIKLGSQMPILQETLFGWIVAGSFMINRKVRNKGICNLSTFQELNDIERFWKIEELNVNNSDIKFSSEELECERIFSDTIFRNAEGRFVVTLAARNSINELGESLAMAEKRMQAMERKFLKNSDFKNAYVNFMKEYLEMGHMSRIDESELDQNKLRMENKGRVYYLPHHGVVNNSSTTTKLRVVFDGSCKSNTNLSLNDVLKVGPNIQDDIFTILCKFRKYNVVITSDIAKMYRMINVIDHQRDLQRIVWRESRNTELEHYRLNTITYGTGPASFLAMRCLKQISLDIKSRYPEAAHVIGNDFYMDDLITGGNSVDEVIELASTVYEVLKEYGFFLRKWNSNKLDVLKNLSFENSNELSHFIKDGCISKTLGIFWNAKSDKFEYVIDDSRNELNITKRTILSSIAKIFDPLGLIGPIITKAKLLMQSLWQLKIGWDETVPTKIISIWRNFEQQLKMLGNLKIPRHVITEYCRYLELHGFSDASEKASGACVFVRSIGRDNSITVKLLCSKSRVAPLKTITIPRLELCGAVLLTRLMKRVNDSLGIEIPMFYWCDSTIVLCWLNDEPHIWKSFVASRVSEIQNSSDIKNWHHVSSKDNPADIISRGVNTSDLINLDLWWYGPKFLRENTIKFNPLGMTIDIPERRKIKPVVLISQDSVISNLVEKYSTLTKLLHVTGWCLRFIRNCRLKQNLRLHERLSIIELDDSLTTLVKVVQATAFQSEITSLGRCTLISNMSKIKSLDPFLGSDNLLRVGGRLRKAPIDFDRKFQIILPYKSHLTNLIVQHEHFRQLHAGPQAILNSVRQRFWPVNGRRVVRSILSKCFVCFKANPTLASQKMGDLPVDRVSPNRPFYISGTDFAGPFHIKDGKLRNRAIVKAYMCIFVCLTTKAVHIEAVSDLSAESFLNCLKRFISRRGLCKRIYSDNGSNYLGSSNYLREMQELVYKVPKNDKILNFFTENKIEWMFIPAKSPHQGGIWESAIKSAKYHVVRIMGNNHLSFEELTTIFSQIEAVLNSRPLTELSHDPADLSPLTPGHFLIGSPLTAIPEVYIQDVPMNRLSRYQLLQKIVKDFWSRWSLEYLSSLQKRNKWQNTTDNLQVGDMVLLKEDNLSPLYWNMGRILETHPGSDGAVRVISVKTNSGVLKRSVQKVCVLPKY